MKDNIVALTGAVEFNIKEWNELMSSPIPSSKYLGQLGKALGLELNKYKLLEISISNQRMIFELTKDECFMIEFIGYGVNLDSILIEGNFMM